MSVSTIFRHCVQAIRNGELIQRISEKDKEFHFQNWFEKRLKESGLAFEYGKRNSYPDFRMLRTNEGYEVKGLAYPGRELTFDSNSQMPSGIHKDCSIFYVFGRYPKEIVGNSYPVLDLVFCDGDFLNADHDYTHKNKSIKEFGSYGDVMIRDRKMYVVPTPYYLIEGVDHLQTLIMKADANPGPDFFKAGELIRNEAAEEVIGYSFDLQTNDMISKKIPNPSKGKQHNFQAWRQQGSPESRVRLMKKVDKI